MPFTVSNRKIINWLLVLLLCLCGDVLPKNPYKSGEVRADYPKGCAYLRCKRGDQCVNRKFWCKNPPCPSMLYCSKSRKESLKGPSSCDAVRCSKGFVCLVRARRCRWGEACEQQIARCVSERDYFEGPASCADFRCPSGHRCILRESLCAKPPCKLLKSCANTKDVNSWFEGCKNLGCLSEHECFLRRPDRDCANSRCKHSPDCSAKSEDELEMNEQCRGWVCPKGQECSTHTEGPCKRDSCRISRSCHKPLMIPANGTRPRKHSWKDDIKLSFYSKLDRDTAEKNSSSSYYTPTSKMSRGRATGNMKISTNPSDRQIQERPIYGSPVYVSPNARPTSSGPSSASPDNTSGREVQPTVTSLSTWLNHLKLKTGVDAVEVWIRKAERQESYGEFREWLESVKDMLGSAAYDLWLEEVRAMTVTSTAFQKWLPPAPTKRPPDTHRFIEQNRNMENHNHETSGIYSGLPNSIKYRANEDNNYSQRESINGRGYETGSVRNDDSKEDDYIFPPHIDSPTIKPEITFGNEIPPAAGFLRPTLPTIAANEWSQFYPPDPRIIQQAYPFQQNFGNIAPWANQPSPFQGYGTSNFLNPWYQQHFRTNWSLQQPPVSNPDFLRSNTWQDQFIPRPYPRWPQERDPRDRFSIDRRNEPTTIPLEILRRLNDERVQLYPRNSTNEDSSWMKYFPNPYQTSQFVQPESFGSFPMTDDNFDAYVSWPGSSNQGFGTADVPHRRSKHEDSAHSTNVDRDEDRSVEKSRGMPEDSEFYTSGFPWPIVDPWQGDYYRYLLDYNRRNLNDKTNPTDSLPTPIVPSLSRSHRVDVEPPLSSPNRYFADNARVLSRPEYHWPSYYPQDQLYRIAGTLLPPSAIPLERQAVRVREDNRRTDPFPKPNLSDVDADRTRGFLFRNRDIEIPGQPMGVPDLWNPRYRTPLSSIVHKINEEPLDRRDMMEKIVPVVSPRRRVAPNWIPPMPNENVHRSEDDDYEDEAKIGKDYPEDDEEEMQPLLLSLQGYIETPEDESSQHSMDFLNNSTILPVYTTNDDNRGRDDCIEYYTGSSDDSDNQRTDSQHRAINFFRNPKYGGDPDFPNYLKSAFDVEAAMIMRNVTGQSEVEIKGMTWEYEDEEDEKFNEDTSNFANQRQDYIPSTVGLSNINQPRDWSDNTSGGRYDGGSENYYYDGSIDYEDDVAPEARSYFDLEKINGHDSVNREEVRDDISDQYYNNPEHKTFKKNRPL